jgi:hypothetical protein
MTDSSESSRKRGRELSSSHSSGGDHAFDDGLSQEFGGEQQGSDSSSSDEVSARSVPGAEGLHEAAGRKTRVYGYDEHGERLPSTQAPRAAKSGSARAGTRRQADDEEGHERHEGFPDGAQETGGRSGVPTDHEGEEFTGWEDDLDGEFGADLYDDEETADQASKNPQWAKRIQRELTEWQESRPLFAAALLRRQAAGAHLGEALCSTSGCTGLQAVKCVECTQGRAVCADCDERLHPYAHFHDRSCLMPEGRFWKSVGPDFIVRGGRLERSLKVFATPPAGSCRQCKENHWGAPVLTNKPLTVVTLAGRFDFARALFPCQTPGCGFLHEQCALDAIEIGAWPGTVSDCQTMYETALLVFWDKMSKDQPGASITALVKVLEGISREKGRVSLVYQPVYTRKFSPKGAAFQSEL